MTIALLLGTAPFAGLPLPLHAQTQADQALPRAVIFMYQRFGDDTAPGTSIDPDLFAAHLAELKSGDYKVLPVPQIIEALRSGRPLPERTVGITIDQAHRSVYTEAWPRLRAAGLPFTLFVTSDTIDRAGGDAMSWSEIRELASAGVTIGNQTASHPHLIDQDRSYVLGQIQRGAERIKEETDVDPVLFAYPYGEYADPLRLLLRDRGYKAAFGLHSGVAHARADMMTLPRFTMNDAFGSIERFRLAAQALPLLVSDVTPEEMVVDQNPPSIGFTVDALAGDLSTLACFVSNVGRTRLENVGGRRIEARFDAPLPQGRVRINCTMPVDDGRWRWFGMQLLVMP